MSEQQQEQKQEERKVGRPKKIHKCPICGEEFSTKAGLKAHLGSKHVVETLQIEKTEPPKEEKKEAGEKKPNISVVIYILIIIVAGLLFYFFVLRRRGGESEY